MGLCNLKMFQDVKETPKKAQTTLPMKEIHQKEGIRSGSILFVETY